VDLASNDHDALDIGRRAAPIRSQADNQDRANSQDPASLNVPVWRADPNALYGGSRGYAYPSFRCLDWLRSTRSCLGYQSVWRRRVSVSAWFYSLYLPGYTYAIVLANAERSSQHSHFAAGRSTLPALPLPRTGTSTIRPLGRSTILLRCCARLRLCVRPLPWCGPVAPPRAKAPPLGL